MAVHSPTDTTNYNIMTQNVEITVGNLDGDGGDSGDADGLDGADDDIDIDVGAGLTVNEAIAEINHMLALWS